MKAVEAVPSEAARPRSTAVRLRLVLSYDGTGFRGFAAQQGQRTVAGELAAAIATVARHPVELTCAGRTDAGVHALGQVVHVDVRPEVDPTRLAKAVNAMLGPAVVVQSVTVAPAGFDARHSARARSYRYLVLESPIAGPACWRPCRGTSAARSTCGPWPPAPTRSLGEHDFRAFCRRAPGTSADDPIVRRVIDARFGRGDVALRPAGRGPAAAFDITASSFCHQMVRSVTGALVDVGRLRWRAADITRLLRAGVRPSGTTIAPPTGCASPRSTTGPSDGAMAQQHALDYEAFVRPTCGKRRHRLA